MLSSKSPHITRQKKIEMIGLQSTSSSSSSSSTETYAVSPSMHATNNHNEAMISDFDFNKINIGTLGQANDHHYLDSSYDSNKLLNITSAKNNKSYTKSKSVTTEERIGTYLREHSPATSTSTSYRDSRSTNSSQNQISNYEFPVNDHLMIAKDSLSKSTNHLTSIPNALISKNKSNEMLNGSGSSPTGNSVTATKTTTTTTTAITSVSKEKFMQQLKHYQEQQKNGGSKSPSSNLMSSTKNFTTTKSVPIAQQPKQRRIFDLMRLSQQAGSFFSRSCPGEEMAQFVEAPAVTAQTTGSANGSTSEIVENKLIDANTTNQQKFRNFLAFARTGKNGKKQQLCPTGAHETGTNSNSSSPSNSSSALSNTDHPTFNFKANSSPKNGNSKSNSTMSMIGSYEVDLEKLARELILPSMDAPLTSFNSNSSLSPDMSKTRSLNPNSLAKPPLQTSKTLESSTTDKPVRKLFIRSLTQNK